MNSSPSTKRKYNKDHYEQSTNYKRPHYDDTVSETNNEEIKQFSSDQRLAQLDEPICVVCGKYGEYINNDTEQDVCSLQCKAINTDLNQHRRQRRLRSRRPVINTQLHDYVASNLHAKLTNYQEPDSIRNQTNEQVDQMLKAHDIKINGSHIPKPFSTYDQLQSILGDTLLSNIESIGWSMATGIQRQAVTISLAGRDLLAIAPKRSGKTGAYLIPLIVHCMSLSKWDQHKRRAGPYALIISPTRESCIKIETVCKQLTLGIRNLRTGLLIGGEPLPTQLYRLKKGVQIVIGTPGRILEIASQHAPLLRLWKIQMLVMDSVDTMLSQGFGSQVKQIMGKFPNTTVRQTLYYFTKLSEDKMMDGLCRHLNSPVNVKVLSKEEIEDENRVYYHDTGQSEQTKPIFRYIQTIKKKDRR
ncbi:P-loop containing nucleoside triphosphate hydrolase protein [Cokeromyces recurvatus]|uniref:P-loop containing nucleoside triphosphate hydrolase protein n=1 Tax=Cokeromyces recurvatus TaxID=90255 RepID=UPI0022210968|nr:P-loop containing nucleoside triphosphate hydrolase protein [Cokeromyces recurvatus]KAI7899001.1 P-loop containing nucleoside triphosphate hydrolase protein [Cokeromyces recurvatus]